MGAEATEQAFEFPATRPAYTPGPELANRVCELGLEQNLEDLRDLGFTVIHGIDPKLTARLRAAIVNSPNAGDEVLGQDPVWIEAITHPKLLAIAEAAVGKNFLISQVVGGVKPKGGRTFGLHVDQNWTPAPFPEHTQMITFCWVTDDSYEAQEGGPTLVIPGSHKHRRHPSNEEAELCEGALPIRAPASSVAVWRGETWHGSYPRMIEGERVTAHITYARLACRQIEDYSPFMSEAWLAGKPPILRTLLGLEDCLGKKPAERMPRLRPTYALART
jgi:hypothetical protein